MMAFERERHKTNTCSEWLRNFNQTHESRLNIVHFKQAMMIHILADKKGVGIMMSYTKLKDKKSVDS